jgi:hypothetical protein
MFNNNAKTISRGKIVFSIIVGTTRSPQPKE